MGELRGACFFRLPTLCQNVISSDLGIGPTFEDLLEFASEYIDRKVRTKGTSGRIRAQSRSRAGLGVCIALCSNHTENQPAPPASTSDAVTPRTPHPMRFINPLAQSDCRSTVLKCARTSTCSEPRGRARLLRWGRAASVFIFKPSCRRPRAMTPGRFSFTLGTATFSINITFTGVPARRVLGADSHPFIPRSLSSGRPVQRTTPVLRPTTCRLHSDSSSRTWLSRSAGGAGGCSSDAAVSVSTDSLT